MQELQLWFIGEMQEQAISASKTTEEPTEEPTPVNEPTIEVQPDAVLVLKSGIPEVDAMEGEDAEWEGV